MSVDLIEHKVGLSHSEDPFTSRERDMCFRLLRRLRFLQRLDEEGRPNSRTEAERAALLWALTELGVICGHLVEERRGADLHCVRPQSHGDEHDGLLTPAGSAA